MNLKSLGETQRKVTLAFDEMKVSLGLVYSHSTSDITGFTSLGTMNTECEECARKCGDEMTLRWLLTFWFSWCGLYAHHTAGRLEKGSHEEGGVTKEKANCSFSEKQEERLVEFFSVNPVFFDKSHPQYQNQQQKDKLLDQLAKELHTTSKYHHIGNH